MTPPTLTPAEQISRFIERHPGEWQIGAWQGDGTMTTPPTAAVLPIFGNLRLAILEGALSLMVWIIRANGEHVGLVGHHVSMDAPLLARVSARVADAVQLRGEEGCTDTLPPWLRDPVRRILRTRAGELLTLAGSSPADVVSAAETLDEALCARPVVEVTGVLRALMSIGMSCRWATGANEAKDDYVGFVSRRLDVVAEERDGLRAAIKQALADLDAYSETDKGVRIATLPARAALRRVLGVT